MATLLKLVHDNPLRKGSIGLFLLGLLCLSACSSSHREEVDQLNDISYAFHYKDLDSTWYYARKAYALKNMLTGEQQLLTFEEVIEVVK